MRSRLEDLIATADRQLASGSYDAAIDTYRTALSEPGAVEAGIAERLEAACRTRDAALGVVRPVGPPPELLPEPPVVETTTDPAPSLPAVLDNRPIEPPPELSAPLPAPSPEIGSLTVAAQNEAAYRAATLTERYMTSAPPVVEMTTEPRPESPPPELVDNRPIEPPSFHLIEDDPPVFERPQQPSYEGPEPLSILDPKPPAEELDSLWMVRIAVAALIVGLVCLVAALVK